MESYRKWSIGLKYLFFAGCIFNAVYLIVNIVKSTPENLITMLWTVALTGLCLYESKAMMKVYLENQDGKIETEGMFETAFKKMHAELHSEKNKNDRHDK